MKKYAHTHMEHPYAYEVKNRNKREKIPSEITMESWSETENRFFEWDVRQNNQKNTLTSTHSTIHTL